MKTNFYILLIFLISFSLGNAQEVAPEIEISEVVSVSIDDKNIPNVDAEIYTNKENDSLLIDANKLKETIARSSSDIRIYLNRERKAGNISFVFPKINKAVKA
ncbi:hypothetical protein MBM09_12325 [Flaviramulus sp. BrNp1-15]|uniref:hypothetical protein n=1 Tax=Flaviramulus sp. BrNp1-15 TaxID=2916754 RepID=UPI001EE93AC2|nr:hypothetical protein [Flaviramulus sp. BrNp1-15]ULC58696.1 hypothetical protein MBM09_12325 [Flaviramulus sp. BrNp1-15]